MIRAAGVVFAVAVVATAACNRSPARKPPPGRDATSAGDGSGSGDGDGLPPVQADWTSRGPVTTSVVSGPRDTWPCRFEGTLANDITDGEERVERVVSYDGGPAQCRIPVDIADDGVVGCATSLEITNLERGFTLQFRYRYDDAGHLTGVALGQMGWTTYTWDGDTVRGSRADDDEFTKPGVLDELRVVGDQVHVMLFDEPSQRLWLQDGHVAYSQAGTSSTVHRWEGGRLTAIESTGTALHETSRLRAVPCP